MNAPALRERSDKELLRLYAAARGERRGDDAVSELFRRYHARVYQWCYRYARDHERALDLSQEVFLGAYESLPGYGERASFSSWLFAIARNRCVSAMRRWAAAERSGGDPDLLPDARWGPDSEIEERQEKEALLSLLREHLEPIEQEALCLQVFERMPIDAITEALAIRGSTGARGVLQTARRKLRAALAGKPEGQGESTDA